MLRATSRELRLRIGFFGTPHIEKLPVAICLNHFNASNMSLGNQP